MFLRDYFPVTLFPTFKRTADYVDPSIHAIDSAPVQPQTGNVQAAVDRRTASRGTSVVIKSSPAINNTWLTSTLKRASGG